MKAALIGLCLVAMADILRPVDHGSVDDWLRPMCQGDTEVDYRGEAEFAAKSALCRELLPSSARWGS